MRVCLFYTGPINGTSGGMEKVLSSLAQGLKKVGISVVVRTADLRDGCPFFEFSNGVEYKNVFSDKTILEKKLYKLKRELALVFSFDRVAKRKKRAEIDALYKASSMLKYMPKAIDCYISFSPESTFILDLCNVRVPILTMCHGRPVDYFGTDSYDIFEKRVLKSEKFLIPGFFEELSGYVDEDKIEVIPNSIDDVFFSHSDQKREKLIVNVGRFCEEKDQLMCVDAFSKIASKYPDWILELWGDFLNNEPYYNKVLNRIKEYSLEGRVLIKGTTRDIHSVYRRASLFLFPSRHEGFGLVVAEAMASELPVVARKSCSSVNRIVSDGVSGFLCADSDKDFSQRLEILLSDQALRERMGQKGKLLATEFSEERIMLRWKEMLTKVIGAQ